MQREEIERLKAELANEKTRADNEKARANALQKEVTSLKNAKSAEGKRKSFPELTDRRQRDVVSNIKDTLEGSVYSVTSGVEAPEADVHKSFSYYYMQGITKEQYKGATKLPKRKLLKLNWLKLIIFYSFNALFN